MAKKVKNLMIQKNVRACFILFFSLFLFKGVESFADPNEDEDFFGFSNNFETGNDQEQKEPATQKSTKTPTSHPKEDPSAQQEKHPLTTEKDNASPPIVEKTQLVLLNTVAIKVNNIILTGRDLNIFFALRQLSTYLKDATTVNEVAHQMALVLGLENYIKNHDLYNILPTRTDLSKREELLNTNLDTTSLQDTLDKIDKSHTLLTSDIRKFLYYQIIYEKGFVYMLQQDFSKKIFAPRDDEIYYIYKQISRKDPRILSSPSQITLLNILAPSPKDDAKREHMVDLLMELKSKIMKAKTFKGKKALFIEGINQYAAPKYRSTKEIGPLDQSLIAEDFPEYKDLFLLEKGDVSNIIEKNGFMRLVFIINKGGNILKDIKNPQVRASITNMLYERKSQRLFHNFLTENLTTMSVKYNYKEN
jgi:hypothetical protein